MKKLSVRYLVVTVILTLSLALGTGCEFLTGSGTFTPPAPSPPPAPVTQNVTAISPGWTLPALSSQATPLPSIADVVARVKPSVVAINTEIVELDFFNQPSTVKGAGSGWIIDKSGIIVTNNHVVEGAKTITVTLDDGRTFPAEADKVAADKLTDLAVVKINAQDLPAATVGDSSKLRVGDWVVALGNSLGRGIRATLGIVSQQSVSVPVDGQTLYGLIETDAAINPGNSGGPLVNIAGEVIGINSVKIAQVGVESVGYSIGTSEAMTIIQQLINTGFVVRAWLGVGLFSVDQFVILRYNLTVDKGAFVTSVVAGSPADRAGLRAGDVITRFSGQDIPDVDTLIKGIRAAKVGQKVELEYWRGETKLANSATLIESPSPR